MGELGKPEALKQVPVLKILDECDFAINPANFSENYTVLTLPEELRALFESGVHAVRINSREVAAKLPSFGGKTQSDHSLTPHQDQIPTDPRRFLALSKTDSEKRDSSTYVLLPETLSDILPEIVAYFEKNRKELKEIAVYQKSFQMTETQFAYCFEEGGLERIVAEAMKGMGGPSMRDFIISGIMTYCIQGGHADRLVTKLLRDHSEKILIEDWEKPGVLIVDNRTVFHGRDGKNGDILNRNWLI